MCCSNAAWKREEVPDHKFDFVNVEDYRSNSFGIRIQYVWFWILAIKSIAVYVADIYTAVALLASNRWSLSILQSPAAQGSATLQVPFTIGKWVFTGCIILSFLLLLWEARKARAIVKSRDISYAFTNVMSQDYYSARSYNHFCFFCQIDNSKKKKDEFAFFIFFTFKGWKRLLLADAPRQAINAITLYSFGASEGWTTDFSQYYNGNYLKLGLLLTMLFTLVIWVGSAILLIIAAFMYIPLLCYIQGNLKEYCCHKVDKRIAELMKRKNRNRQAKEAHLLKQEALGDFSHLKDKKPRQQPTLPSVGLHDHDLYSQSGSKFGSDAGSMRKGHNHYPPSQDNSSYNGNYDRKLNQNNRKFYEYNNSEPNSNNSLHQQSYSGQNYTESIHSFEGFAQKGQEMGNTSNYPYPPAPGMQRTLTESSKAPTYKTNNSYNHQQQESSHLPYENDSHHPPSDWDKSTTSLNRAGEEDSHADDYYYDQDPKELDFNRPFGNSNQNQNGSRGDQRR